MLPAKPRVPHDLNGLAYCIGLRLRPVLERIWNDLAEEHSEEARAEILRVGLCGDHPIIRQMAERDPVLIPAAVKRVVDAFLRDHGQGK